VESLWHKLRYIHTYEYLYKHIQDIYRIQNTNISRSRQISLSNKFFYKYNSININQQHRNYTYQIQYNSCISIYQATNVIILIY
jgi:hypothetical protein